MRMNARRTTKVVVRTTTEEGGAAGAAFSRQPFGIGAWPALALSLGLHTHARFALLRAIIPGKLPVAPARELFRGSPRFARRRRQLQAPGRRTTSWQLRTVLPA